MPPRYWQPRQGAPVALADQAKVRPQAKGDTAPGSVPDAHIPGKRHAPMMTTADLALRADPIYERISRRFMQNPEEFADAVARASRQDGLGIRVHVSRDRHAGRRQRCPYSPGPAEGLGGERAGGACARAGEA